MQETNIGNSREVTTLARGAGIVFAGTLFGLLLKYIFQLIVARHLGVGLFGTFFLGVTIFSVLERLSGLGLPNGILRFVSVFRGQGDQERIKGTILSGLRFVAVAGFALLCLVVLLSTFLSNQVFHDANLIWVLRILAVGSLFSGLTEILVYTTQAFQLMQYKVWVRFVFEPLSRIFLVWLGFWLGWRLFGATLAFAVVSVFGTVVAFQFMLKVFPLFKEKKVLPRFETRAILRFSWPLFFVGFLNLTIAYAPALILGYFRTSEEVGIFGSAFRTAVLMSVIMESFNAIFSPIIADLSERKALKKLEELFKVVTKWIFTISFPVFLSMVLFPKMILNLWGEDFISGATCLIFISCGQLINCGVGSSGYMLMMTGHTRIILINALFFTVASLGLSVYLIPEYGILGAALSYAIPLGFINLIRLVEVYIILGIHPYRWDFFKPLTAGAGAAAAGWVMKVFVRIDPFVFSLLIGVLVVASIYISILVFLKIPREDLWVMEKIKMKLFTRRRR